jgi:hypothetical protein
MNKSELGFNKYITEHDAKRIKMDIYNLFYIVKDYEKAKKVTENLMVQVINSNSNFTDSEIKQHYYYYFTMLSLCHNQLGNLNESIRLAKFSRNYISSIEEAICCYWTLARQYEKVNKNKSTQHYNRAIGICSNLHTLTELRFNKANLQHDLLQMQEQSEIYKTLEKTCDYDYVTNVQSSLITKQYILKWDMEQVINYMVQINDEVLKQECIDLMKEMQEERGII